MIFNTHPMPVLSVFFISFKMVCNLSFFTKTIPWLKQNFYPDQIRKRLPDSIADFSRSFFAAI